MKFWEGTAVSFFHESRTTEFVAHMEKEEIGPGRLFLHKSRPFKLVIAPISLGIYDSSLYAGGVKEYSQNNFQFENHQSLHNEYNKTIRTTSQKLTQIKPFQSRYRSNLTRDV